MSSPPATDGASGQSIERQGLDAQTQLLPYALIAFGVCLPVLVWVGAYAPNRGFLSLSLVTFAIGWASFYVIVDWLKTRAAADLRRRARVQLLGGLIWAAAIAQVALFADQAGPARTPLLMLSLGAGLISVFFTAPWLTSLLVVGPAAIAVPLTLLLSGGSDLELARLGLAATALALALALMVNRILRAQFALAAEREALATDRALQAEAARKLARAKSDLVATLSEEIRTGLTAVGEVLATAAKGRSAPTRQQVGTALDAVNDLLSVLETTVDSERAEDGVLRIERRAVDLGEVLREAADRRRAAAAAKNLELALEIPEPPRGSAMVDPHRTRQALDAILANAVQYTLRGRIELRLATFDDAVEISVIDSGPGLSPDELAVALQPFQRVGRTAAGQPGAGLGLSLADRLARLMGGELKAESTPGLGSVFTLRLPYAPDIAPPAFARTAAPPPPPRLRVLVLERDRLGAAMLRASLEQLGHQVVQATDVSRACELSRTCDFDLIVVDAVEVGAELRALPGAAGATPMIQLTDGEAESAPDAEALLRRPVTAPALARAVAEARRAAPAPGERAAA